MSQFSVPLATGAEKRLEVAGRFFMIRSITNGATLDVVIEVRGEGDRNDEEFADVVAGFKARIENSKFDVVRVKASVDCTVVYVISDNDVDFDFFAGAEVNATISGPVPLPVSNDRGSPGNPLHVSAVTVSDTPATSVSNNAAVSVDDTGAVMLTADADRREARFLNQGPDAVALGAPGLTWAERTIVIEMGDVWVEERAANLAWSAITDTGDTADVTVQEVFT